MRSQRAGVGGASALCPHARAGQSALALPSKRVRESEARAGVALRARADGARRAAAGGCLRLCGWPSALCGGCVCWLPRFRATPDARAPKQTACTSRKCASMASSRTAKRPCAGRSVPCTTALSASTAPARVTSLQVAHHLPVRGQHADGAAPAPTRPAACSARARALHSCATAAGGFMR